MSYISTCMRSAHGTDIYIEMRIMEPAAALDLIYEASICQGNIVYSGKHHLSYLFSLLVSFPPSVTLFCLFISYAPLSLLDESRIKGWCYLSIFSDTPFDRGQGGACQAPSPRGDCETHVKRGRKCDTNEPLRVELISLCPY